ncbi:hypothetical protein IAQ61_007659 [Plenodomus lingam]|uniref:uncharacterized protein n=1 Tax=Leptosphaeria maculans TaxID=5022 RepID=UPI00332C6A3D|nr:hypothetical protein IAQ61_007659 [Plenodomus lingam]
MASNGVEVTRTVPGEQGVKPTHGLRTLILPVVSHLAKLNKNIIEQPCQILSTLSLWSCRSSDIEATRRRFVDSTDTARAVRPAVEPQRWGFQKFHSRFPENRGTEECGLWGVSWFFGQMFWSHFGSLHWASILALVCCDGGKCRKKHKNTKERDTTDLQTNSRNAKK